jgi:hypothetical protein
VKGCKREGRISNEEIIQELHIFAIQDKITLHEHNWKEHLDSKNPDCLPKQILADREGVMSAD